MTETNTENAEPAQEQPPPPQIELPEEKGRFLTRINPLRFFRKETPELFIREGHSLIEHQNLALATMAFQKAIQLDPESVEAHKGLGNVFMRKGGRANITTALESFKRATFVAPFEETAYAMSAKLYEKLSMMKEATLERKKMMIVKTLQTDPTNHIANNNMGILLLGQKQVEQAVEYFKKSLSANPSYDIAYRNLAATYYRLATEAGEKQGEEADNSEPLGQARGYISKALAISRTPSSLLVSGKILIEEGRLDEALNIAEEAEGMETANKDVFAFKRIVLEKLNRTKDAQEAYESYQHIVDQTPGG